MIEKVSLFNARRDFLLFLFTSTCILFYSLLISYQEYKKVTLFDSQILQATVLKQYTKTKHNKTFQVLKLKSDDGLTFYTSANRSLQDLKDKKIELEVWTGKINFYEYMTSFYAYSKIVNITKDTTLKHELNNSLNDIHVDKNIANIYQALYTATPLNAQLQKVFSTLGVSHLLAISGFHLGVLSAILFFLLKPIYGFLQNRYFPYRNSNLELFVIVSFSLLAYLLFLDSPPSLLRAFFMLIIGFVLYDRGIKIVSMQTLLLTVVLLLSLFPKLFFALGFWLSVSGVFYIFLFLIHFKDLSKIWQFILVPLWVYVLMLPFSLAIFGNFSVYHPLSIIWTTLFTIFYPLSIFIHLIGFGDLFDSLLQNLILMAKESIHVDVSYTVLTLHVIISLLSVYSKKALWLLLVLSLLIMMHSVYQLLYI